MILLIVLALGFTVGVNVWAAVSADGADVSVIAGDAAAFAAFTVSQRSVVEGHEVVELEYSPGSALSAGRRWSWGETAPSEPEPELLAVLAGFDYEERWSRSRRKTDTPLPFAQELLDEAYAKAESDEDTVLVAHRLDEYMSVVPITFAARGLGEAAGVYAEGLDSPRMQYGENAFRNLYEYDGTLMSADFGLAMPEIMSVSARLNLSASYTTFSVGTDAAYSSRYSVDSSCVYTGDAFYLVLNVCDTEYETIGYNAEGEVTSYSMRTVHTDSHPEPDGLPGGSWGVYRIPCVQAGDGPVPDLSSAENIYPITRGWGYIHLELSEDGEELLLVTGEADGDWLTVIDLATGEQRQRLQLDDEAYFNSSTQYAVGEDSFVISHGRFCVGLVRDGGEWRVEFFADGYDEATPYIISDYFLLSDGFACAWDGESLALLDWENADGTLRLRMLEGSAVTQELELVSNVVPDPDGSVYSLHVGSEQQLSRRDQT